MTISAVIPSYNGVELLRQHLPALAQALGDPVNKLSEVLIVDDGSTDDSVDFVKQNYPNFRVIKHRKNRGFAQAVNMGVRSTKSELVLLLNNDVQVTPSFLAMVSKHFDNPNVFGVSLNEVGYSWAIGQFRNGFLSHTPGPKTTKVHETFWVSGGSSVVRREYWMKLGGFDAKLFAPFYWEDLDLGYRAAKRGWIMLWEPSAKVSHEHETTIGSTISAKRKSRIQERNELLFLWKNITSANLFRKHLVGLSGRLTKGPGYARIILLAALKLPTVLALRRKEKLEAKVSDESIFAKFDV